MGFLMDGLESEGYDRVYTDGQLVRRILGYFRRETGRMVIVALAIVLAALFDIGLPIYISGSLDRLQGNITFSSLLVFASVIIALASLSWCLNGLRQWLSAVAVGNVVLALREDAFDAVVERDLSFYDTFASGKVVSRVTSDTQAFSQVIALSMDLLSRVLLIALLIGYLSSVSLRLTLIVLALAPLIIAVALGFRTLARTTITASRRVSATVSAHIQETVSGISVAKTFRREQAMYDEFVDVNAQSFRINLHSRYVFSGIFPLLNLLAGSGMAILIYFGGSSVRQGTLTAGDWYLFIQALATFWFPLTSIASFWSQFQLGLAAGERVFALIDAESKVVQSDSIQLPAIEGEVRFEKVDFSYNTDERRKTKDESIALNGEGHKSSGEAAVMDDLPSSFIFRPSSPWVLRDFSLTIRPGETLALVGHTGSGKSSIGKLIARFYEFQGGHILIDGHDIRTLDLHAYRSRLGVVTQSPFLFDGSVLENIRYGRSDATDQQVTAIAHQIGGGDWINSLPRGLDSEVGERGASLSLGQRQIVALARVLLQDPAIMILDEATASIDPLTETLIQEGLDMVLQGRTSVVIAHRLSTVRHADRIIVLREGAIIEQGTHDGLLQQGGHYAELYNTYFRHQSLDYIERAESVMPKSTST